MASIKEMKEMEAKKELDEVKKRLKEFQEGVDGRWLEVLKERLRGEGGTAGQRAEWKEEKDELAKAKERLEKDVRKCRKHVEELRLHAVTTETAQAGNDFVTQALGT